MGFNSTIIVMHDAFLSIEKDKEFGKTLVRECLADHKEVRDVPSGPCVNAASVIATHHADVVSLITAGGNYGSVIEQVFMGSEGHHEDDQKVKILKRAAAALGYRLVRKPSS